VDDVKCRDVTSQTVGLVSQTVTQWCCSVCEQLALVLVGTSVNDDGCIKCSSFRH
jgi:hypothetical protein